MPFSAEMTVALTSSGSDNVTLIPRRSLSVSGVSAMKYQPPETILPTAPCGINGSAEHISSSEHASSPSTKVLNIPASGAYIRPRISPLSGCAPPDSSRCVR